MCETIIGVVLLAFVLYFIVMMIMNSKNNKSNFMLDNCQLNCQKETDGLKYNLCVQKCLGHKILQYGGQKCSTNSDCQQGQVCVLGGAYSGSENMGTCMDENSSGVIKWENKNVEDFGAEQCPPLMYWNFDANRCEEIFQGSSSPQYIKHMKRWRGPALSIPGSTTNKYGTALNDPLDKPTDLTVR